MQAHNLQIGYRKQQPVFGNISFAAGEGDMIALLGVNGIGKSTLLRTISGLQLPLSGEITIGQKNLTQTSAAERAALVSIVLTEKLAIDNITVRSLIALGRSPYTGWLGQLSKADEQLIGEIISLLKLENLQHKFFNQLSDGEKQKVLIARALCQQTPVIILDEPTAFLDFRNKRDILQTLRNVCDTLKKTVILSTHDIEAAVEHCNKCWIMTEQKTFEEITKTADFGKDVKSLLQLP
ncbi:MAG: ABC transporter ATP-binding protein [Chitinophagales bacterium]|nr:ABC transporter ATP-binding protein [Chitinophagales bacterium]